MAFTALVIGLGYRLKGYLKESDKSLGLKEEEAFRTIFGNIDQLLDQPENVRHALMFSDKLIYYPKKYFDFLPVQYRPKRGFYFPEVVGFGRVERYREGNSTTLERDVDPAFKDSLGGSPVSILMAQKELQNRSVFEISRLQSDNRSGASLSKLHTIEKLLNLANELNGIDNPEPFVVVASIYDEAHLNYFTSFWGFQKLPNLTNLKRKSGGTLSVLMAESGILNEKLRNQAYQRYFKALKVIKGKSSRLQNAFNYYYANHGLMGFLVDSVVFNHQMLARDDSGKTQRLNLKIIAGRPYEEIDDASEISEGPLLTATLKIANQVEVQGVVESAKYRVMKMDDAGYSTDRLGFSSNRKTNGVLCLRTTFELSFPHSIYNRYSISFDSFVINNSNLRIERYTKYKRGAPTVQHISATLVNKPLVNKPLIRDSDNFTMVPYATTNSRTRDAHLTLPQNQDSALDTEFWELPLFANTFVPSVIFDLLRKSNQLPAPKTSFGWQSLSHAKIESVSTIEDSPIGYDKAVFYTMGEMKSFELDDATKKLESPFRPSLRKNPGDIIPLWYQIIASGFDYRQVLNALGFKNSTEFSNGLSTAKKDTNTPK